jgi:hypothetical protein
MCYIKYMILTYNIHDTVQPIVSIKGATLATITSSIGLKVLIALGIPGRDELFGVLVYVSPLPQRSGWPSYSCAGAIMAPATKLKVRVRSVIPRLLYLPSDDQSEDMYDTYGVASRHWLSWRETWCNILPLRWLTDHYVSILGLWCNLLISLVSVWCRHSKVIVAVRSPSRWLSKGTKRPLCRCPVVTRNVYRYWLHCMHACRVPFYVTWCLVW